MSDAPPPSAAARLLFPAIRWDPAAGDWDARTRLDAWAELGVGGYILFGGPASAVADLTAALRSMAPHPILVGADLERGAGQQFAGATSLPPAAALAALDDLVATRRAGALTGREAVALGVDWVYAPVADLDTEPENPIVGTRSFGADPGSAARHVAAWVEGCREAGALACAKHFPGHGRTTMDSHLALPSVDADTDTLLADLAPFRAAIDAGVSSVMTAHVAFPALDPSGAPATLSPAILEGVLRERLGFRGLVVTDALTMEGARGGSSPEDAAVRAVAAGCDALLYPPDPDAMARALEAARGGSLPEARLAEAVARVRTAAEGRAALEAGRDAGPRRDTPGRDGAVVIGRPDDGPGDGDAVRQPDVGRPGDRAWALRQAVRSVHVLRGQAGPPDRFEVVSVDDDLGGPYPPPPRSTFPATLVKAGLTVLETAEPGGARPVVVAVYADIRGFKGRPGLSPASRAAVREAVDAAPSSLVVLFGHPRLAEGLPGDAVLCTWGGEPLMQEAAAARLAGAPG